MAAAEKPVYHPLMMVWCSVNELDQGEDQCPFTIIDYCKNEKEILSLFEEFGVRDMHVEGVSVEVMKDMAGEVDEKGEPLGAEMVLLRVYPCDTSVVPPHAAMVQREIVAHLIPDVDTAETVLDIPDTLHTNGEGILV